MLEAGCVGKKNVINILFKNIMDGSIAAICFWLLGYGLAFGKTAGGFIGTDNFGLSQVYNNAGASEQALGEGEYISDGAALSSDGWEGFFFQWAFAGTAATIVSGSVAERTRFEAYLLFSALCTLAIYPVGIHWVWGTGWLSAWGANPDGNDMARPILKGNDESNGMIDFAGSGCVHMVGGCSGLMGAILVGPRHGRFGADGKPHHMPPHNTTLMSLGAMILWFGWYGFNCGSTLMLSGGAANVAGKVAVTTTISAASGCLVAVVISRVFEHTFDIGIALNGILAALVGVTAGCSVLDPWQAFLVGCVSPMVYYGAHVVLLRFQIDDPLDAFPIHGCCGAWACLAVGIFCTDKNVQYAAYPNVNDACARGEQFGVQLIGVLALALWSLVASGAAFFTIKVTVGLRVPGDIEDEGLDKSEHGQSAYDDGKVSNKVVPIVVGGSEPTSTHRGAPGPPPEVNVVPVNGNGVRTGNDAGWLGGSDF